MISKYDIHGYFKSAYIVVPYISDMDALPAGQWQGVADRDAEASTGGETEPPSRHGDLGCLQYLCCE